MLASRPLDAPSTLQDLLVRIDRAVSSNNARPDAEVAAILATAISNPALLQGIDLKGSTERYARHRLHAGNGYSVLALVWLPGQMSAVHSHRTWCSLAVQRGCLTEALFSRGDGGVVPSGGRQLRPGDVSHSGRELTTAHRMANLGCLDAVSIHVYPAAFERLGHDVNDIWSV